ncbi:serine hydrolase [Ginsengibacter hankyongi]|uniref:beta-lactamase n=1 Tax=Ginsengibacter hankyongi TaxID=2607284 RepID=A0A5J5II21_9BACT|nr:serine hydrolase [Ginsengibacter hankyongi]KAA9040659.1 serine hydrolase [Ginsengibacter hankyongi]
MKIKKLPVLILTPVLFCACASTKKIQTISQPKINVPVSTKLNDTTVNKVIPGIAHTKTDSFLVNLLSQYPQYFDSVVKNKTNWNVQIIYTQINRDKNNVPSFTDYFFNVDSAKYFYPASTVKLPIALLALQRLNELNKTGITRSTSMITDAAYSGQTATYNDPQTADGRPTIESYIKRIFLVSDNEAFNRLYEFLGQQYINEQLHAKGYEDAQILHRLEISLSEDENRHTNPVNFLDSNNNVLYSQPLVYNSDIYDERHDSLGDAYYSNGQLINTPMNFSKKNRVSLEDLHQILRSVIFPGEVPEKQRFNLTKTDYDFVYQYMSQFPSETIHPSYDSLPDAYVKFLLYGAQKEPLPKNIRIFNKPGDAYGQMIDIAYITDFDKNIEFFLSAAINCNTDVVLNDDKYEYDTIGLPFMKNLGRVIYNYELKRKKTFQPDLSSFKINYDK